MVCVYCGSSTSVNNSRAQKRSNQVWRRRQCQACGAIFSTNEQARLESLLTVQNAASGQHRPFTRDKLFLSVHKSCEHRSNAITDAQALTSTIISSLLKKAHGGGLCNQDIISAVIGVLERFDQAAAVHYKAFHPGQ